MSSVELEDPPHSDNLNHKPVHRYIEPYTHGPVAEVLGKDQTVFEKLRDQRAEKGLSDWAPFKDVEEWELASWLMRHVGQNRIDEFLKLNIIKNQCQLSSETTYKFMQSIDSLPQSAEWRCELVTVDGNRNDDFGACMKETLELWSRDPVEIVRELIGNPLFRESMAYAPERAYADEMGSKRIFDEMWTGDWWWEIQSKLPAGAVIAPIILASDKTKLTQFRGDKCAWPVYLSIGNISKAVRRQPSKHAMILVGYIPVTKLECFTESTRPLACQRFFHDCMERILRPLVQAGTVGVEMTCADGCIRRVFPLLAAYIADHPEQCLLACCKENHCPRGTVDPRIKGEQVPCQPRDPVTTKEALDSHKSGRNPSALEKEGLKEIYSPFWANLPHCDIFACITPDILHQLHKGLFKDHLVKWCMEIVSQNLGNEEVDRRFQAMSDFPGLRYFKNGISHVSQWTGREHKEMQRVFVGLLAGAVEAEVLLVVRAVVDFIYYAQFQSQTSETLDHLQKCLDTFHRHKSIFVTLAIREHFNNIPKIHSLMHYLESIRSRGSADGFNTELPERLHIDYAKEAYRASNKKDYVEQMVVWLRRQEAVDLQEAYLRWRSTTTATSQHPTLNDDFTDDGSDIDELEDLGRQFTYKTSIAHSPLSHDATYAIAKRCPYPNVSVRRLETNHGASEFLPALTDFLSNGHNAQIRPNSMDRFDVYKQLVVSYRSAAHSDTPLLTDRVRATPAKVSSGRAAGKLDQFDTVLVRTDAAAEGTGRIQGFRVARVLVIFELPSHLGYTPHPLAYVEWFTPFRTEPDASVGLFQVSCSTRNHRPNASVISVDRIRRGCHLIPKFGPSIDHRLTRSNTFEYLKDFFLNTYISLDFYSFIHDL